MHFLDSVPQKKYTNSELLAPSAFSPKFLTFFTRHRFILDSNRIFHVGRDQPLFGSLPMPKKPRKEKEPKAKTLSTYEMMQKFPNEQSAIDYLAGILWKNGTVCPFCKGQNVRERKNRKNFWHCNPCNKDFTIRTNTIFHRSHIPLHKWMLAMYLIVTHRKGISALALSKELGITYRSAWHLEHRIRAACGHQVDKFDGKFLGGAEKGLLRDVSLVFGKAYPTLHRRIHLPAQRGELQNWHGGQNGCADAWRGWKTIDLENVGSRDSVTKIVFATHWY